MRGMAAFLLSCMVGLASAADEDTPITTQAELLAWCQAESEAWFVGRQLTPYNWSASFWEKGNVLYVKGSWRVGSQDREVECSVARGARTRYAMMNVR